MGLIVIDKLEGFELIIVFWPELVQLINNLDGSHVLVRLVDCHFLANCEANEDFTIGSLKDLDRHFTLVLGEGHLEDNVAC